MTIDEAKRKVISIAETEIGYLEKNNNNNLYDKTANAGSGNYTKYWAEIKQDYQGQPWCACFITWCFVQAFGREKAEKLLKHFPYVYCPTMSNLFTLNANPKVGDIVLFYRNSTFAHTGMVTNVNGDCFNTIEGNTSGASGIIPNGGGVFRKTYYNSKLPGTKFARIDWSLAAESEDEMTTEEKNEINELKKQVADLTAAVEKSNNVYDWIDTMPDWAKTAVEKLYNKGVLQGDENGALQLSEDMMRMIVVLDRLGQFD